MEDEGTRGLESGATGEGKAKNKRKLMTGYQNICRSMRNADEALERAKDRGVDIIFMLNRRCGNMDVPSGHIMIGIINNNKKNF